MSVGRRVGAGVVAERVNAAAGLLAGGADAVEAAGVLAGRYGVSGRQARRYVDRALAGGVVEVPGPKVVFTVKVPGVLAGRVREAARSTGQSISALVSRALAEFLDRHHPGGDRG